jgi:transcriptional regulator with XRE-family HTH domain
MLLSQRIKELRKEMGLTQLELSERIGVSPSTVGGYEQGVREPDRTMAIKMADLFGCSLDYLMGRTDKRNEALNKPDQYSIIVTHAKDAKIPAEALESYIQFLISQQRKDK